MKYKMKYTREKAQVKQKSVDEASLGFLQSPEVKITKRVSKVSQVISQRL